MRYIVKAPRAKKTNGKSTAFWALCSQPPASVQPDSSSLLGGVYAVGESVNVGETVAETVGTVAVGAGVSSGTIAVGADASSAPAPAWSPRAATSSNRL